LGRAAASGQKVELAAYGKRLQELAASSTVSSGRSLRSVIPELIDELEAAFANQGKLRGLPTGFRRLNKVGLQQCRLYVIAGRPGQGKTAMGLQIAAHVASTGAPVAFFSLEMPAVELAGRVVQANSRVSLNVFGQGGAGISRKLPQRTRRHPQRPNLRFRLDGPGTQAGRSGGTA